MFTKKKNENYVNILFLDIVVAFNTDIPQKLVKKKKKLSLLGLNASLCHCSLDLLTGRPQSVRISNSTTSTLNTGAAQGCMLRPLLFTVLIHDCASKYGLNHHIKFADDTTFVGNNEALYKVEVNQTS